MKLLRNGILGFALVFGLTLAFAQEPANPEPPAAGQTQPAQTGQAPATSAENHAVGQALAHASNEAAEEVEHGEFKHSASVKFVARLTGLSVNAVYWLLVILNFLIIGVAIAWALKKNLPGMFRARTESIRKSMDEARRASEDANRRLSDIESRLSKLDQEILEIKQKAESEAAAEEERIRASAEEDGRKIVASAEQEIETAARAARRELKAYVAELAVSLAEKKVQVDPKTDQALVGTFVRELGKDGRQ